jgi:tRNA pseudouridine13 synthase
LDSALPELPYAHGGPAGSGILRKSPEDFTVEEDLGFEPSGSGEHVFLRIEKRGENTDWLARQLARFASVPQSQVSYAGLKDRHARTVQWFSVQLPGKTEPDWSAFDTPSVTVLETRRHNRKLRRGALRGNRFHLRIALLDHNPERLRANLDAVKREGVPNYFGEQRFGHEGGNLTRAREILSGALPVRDRHERGLLYSAARSFLFNQVLARRVREGTWNRPLPGDAFMFSSSNSFFRGEILTPEIAERVRRNEIHPSGPLWGRGENPLSGEALALETEALTEHQTLCRGLEEHGLEMARRPLRLLPDEFQWNLDADSLQLEFFLPAGDYATTLVRELVSVRDQQSRAGLNHGQL